MDCSIKQRARLAERLAVDTLHALGDAHQRRRGVDDTSFRPDLPDRSYAIVHGANVCLQDLLDVRLEPIPLVKQELVEDTCIP